MHQINGAALAQQSIGRQSAACGSIEPKLAQVHEVSEVEREMNRLHAATNRLHEVLDTLAVRLSSVTSPMPSTAGCNDAAEPRAGSALGSAIKDQRTSVEEALRRLGSLISSLAV
jgi:hypothetical protein